METRRLGRTGHLSSVAVLGAAAFARSNPEETGRVFHAALDAGVNHLDIAPRYGDAERLVGPLLPAVRDRLFVGCKTTRRNGDGARAQLEESLTTLGCDTFDLYQMHAVTTVDELDDRAPAAEAILRARDEGLCRFVGVTGHDMGAPRAHAEAVRRWDLDTVMFPVNPRRWSDADYRRDAEALLDLAAERDLGVMAIKAAAARPWRTDEQAERHATTWYEPYTAADEVARGVRFALSTPGVHAICTPGDVDVLRAALEAANSYTPMTGDERADAISATRDEELIFPMR
ncbi:MAG TPA: aldo/keto reductase [Acidimicrobiales bacterium]|nr:aldo/keto reductase [Acidimicrobiales bacterium]